MQEQSSSVSRPSIVDTVEAFLRSATQFISIFLFGLLPILFIPVSFMPQEYVKTVLIIVGLGVIAIFWSLHILRSGTIELRAPVMLLAFVCVGAAGVISALLSGDMRDALIGDDFGVHTALFTLMLVAIALHVPLLSHSKTTLMRLYILFAASAVLVALFHLSRLFFGPDFLSFGIFTAPTQSLVGTWNDVALFFGLAILLALVALEQLPLTKSGQLFFGGVVALSLCMLAVVNFFAVWIVLGLVSLSLLMYGMTKNRFGGSALTPGAIGSKDSLPSILVSGLVFIVSVVCIIGGSSVGSSLSALTGISYLEVRPSFEATVDVGRAVYAHDAFVGIGPNKFIDAWRQYKSTSINETLFWATDFVAGNGYITTAVVQTGILGLVAWVLFFITFIYAGFTMLFRTAYTDRFWYFIGTSSFVGAAYIWVMALMYVPGALMLILAALFTGVMCVAYGALVSTRGLSLSVLTNKRATFVLVGCAMLVIVGTTSGLYYLSKHTSSVYTFGKALSSLSQGGTLDVTEAGIAQAYTLYNNELYALQVGAYQLAKINAYASAPELDEAGQQQLQSSIRNGINAGQIAVEADPTDAQGWSLLGSIYSILASAKVEGAKERATESFEKARTLDPQNPVYALRLAQLYAATGDAANARTKVSEAIAGKRNYTEALTFLAQLDIFEGKTDDAINTTAAIVRLEPNNPARYYQLGVLLSAAGKTDDAIAAFNEAIRIDTNYANARYFLALGLVEKGDTEAALAQLDVVAKLNPENQEVKTLIERIKSGAPLTDAPSGGVVEPQQVTSDNNTVTTTKAPDTPLISPVNTVPERESSTNTQ